MRRAKPCTYGHYRPQSMANSAVYRLKPISLAPLRAQFLHQLTHNGHDGAQRRLEDGHATAETGKNSDFGVR